MSRQTQREIRVGVVGAGYVCSHHLRALRELGLTRVVALCDQDLEKARALAARFGVERTCRTLAEMSEAQPEVIHVLTPPESHCALAMEALQMGCHVLVEKPMAETVEECDRMIMAARERGLVLSVNHSARFDPVVVEALERVGRGECGEVLSVLFVRSSDYPPYGGGPLPAWHRQGSYPFRDLGVHGLYLLESFLGPVRELEVRWYSRGRELPQMLDEWRATVVCERGTGQMFFSWNARPMQNELWIHGTRGVLHVDCFLQVCEWRRLWPGPKQAQFVLNGVTGAARRLWKAPWNVIRFAAGSLKPSPGIYASVQEFHRALAEGRPTPVSPEEGRRAVYWVEQAARRADEEFACRRTRLAAAPAAARILVTGAGGFLGSALVRRLREQGERPRVLVRREGSEAEGLPVVYGNLGDPEAVDRAVHGVEVVFHVGAGMRGGAAEFQAGTIWGTRNVIEACLRHGVRRLVYVSSLGVLDHAGHRPGEVVTENSPVEPHPNKRGWYTRSKLEAERMVRAAVAERGLPAVILRPGQIFGPGAERTAPNGVIALGRHWLVAGRGKFPLPLVYVEDVVDALLKAAAAEGVCGEVIHIVDPTEVRQEEYLRWCLRKLGGEIRVRRVPVSVLLAAGLGVELVGKAVHRDLPLSVYRIRSLRPLWPCDVSKARRLLGWTPRVGVLEGLRRTFGTA
ncbi:MAG: NAD-dependent epimerase/dehydratase family protein [Bryobacterales bacterium]|nr:NAD-dependent epimerase/dehydratase family protein [Bryobacteraceae bacterium]MDW8355379.1 NAD-dependent epimerase/dehydratase family protein [Bryobacterales bacterium]